MQPNKIIDVVLVSLGTPTEPNAAAIRKFLRRFLSDKRVVELPRLFWMPMLYLVILPFRSRKLAPAYQRVWQQHGGSPLRLIAQQQAQALQSSLDTQQISASLSFEVHAVMAYDEENVEKFLTKRARLQRTTVILPLYPQYSATTTGAVYDQIFAAYQAQRSIPDHRVINSYYAHFAYRQALASSVENFWHEHGRAEHLLISFHGIPQRCVDRGDPYYQQCINTAKNVSDDLFLQRTQYSYGFQSRLGSAQWLQPYTEQQVVKIAEQGVELLDVICPSFSADCLETFEEIALRAHEIFISAGGKQLRLIPSLNAQQKHIALLQQLVLSHLD